MKGSVTKLYCRTCDKDSLVPTDEVRLTPTSAGVVCPLCGNVQWQGIPDKFRAYLLLGGAAPVISEPTVLAFLAGLIAHDDCLSEIAAREVTV
jgi:hypothetical protein